MGASSGIGRALAETFASRGVKIGIAARSRDRLEQLADKYPGLIEWVEIDITKPRAVTAFEELIDKMGGMDIYIHASGIALRNPEMNPETEVMMADTNATGLIRMCSTAFRYFYKTGCPGQIAAISSVAATRGIGELAAYSASKSCAATYLEALRQLSRIKNMNVCVTDIRPGWVRTPLIDPDKHYPMEMSLQYAVPYILKAIARQRRVATIDWRWALLCALWRRLPRSVWEKMSGFAL